MRHAETVDLAATTPGEADQLVAGVARQASTQACVGAVQVGDEQAGLLLVRRRCDVAESDAEPAAVSPVESLAQARPYVRMETVPDYGWWQRQRSVDHTDMLMTLFAMRFPDEKARRAFIEATRGHGDYCSRNEPDTQVYGLGIVVRQRDRTFPIAIGDLVVVMICTDQRSIEKHRDDPRHLALGSEIAASGIPVENHFAQTYRLSAAGFLWR